MLRLNKLGLRGRTLLVEYEISVPAIRDALARDLIARIILVELHDYVYRAQSAPVRYLNQRTGAAMEKPYPSRPGERSASG